MQDHINEVEKEFSPLHNTHKTDLELLNHPRYITSIFIFLFYLVLPFIVGPILVAQFSDNEFVLKNATAAERALEFASSDVNAILIINTDAFDAADPIFEQFFYPVYTDGGYTIYTHTSAGFYQVEINQGMFEVIAEELYLTEDGFLSITSGEKDRWSNNAPIVFYIPSDDIAPMIVDTEINTDNNLIPAGFLLQSDFSQLFSFTVYLAMTIPMIFILMPSLKIDLPEFKRQQTGEIFAKVGIGVLYIYGMNIAMLVVGNIFNDLFNVPDQISANQLSINQALASPYFFLTIIMAVVCAPIVEELVFRKSFFGLIKNQTTALIISSLVFGAIHISTELIEGNLLLAISNSLSYIGGGLILGFIYMQNKKNIYVNILVHAVYNLIGVIITVLVLS